MYAIALALRHLRSRAISWLTILVVALIVATYMVIISVMEGFTEHWMGKLRALASHMEATVGGYRDGIADPGKCVESLRAIQGIKAVTYYLEVPAVILFEQGDTVGVVYGINLADEYAAGRFRDLFSGLERFGTYEVEGRKIPGCVIGSEWQKSYGLRVGDTLTVLTRPFDRDEPRPKSFYIEAVFSTGNPYLDRRAYVDYRVLDGFLRAGGRARGLSVWVEGDPDRPDLEEIRDRARMALETRTAADWGREGPRLAAMVEVKTWKERDHNLYYAMKRENRIMRFIMGFFLVLVGVFIMCIIWVLVTEKTRDVGILRSVGATPAGVASAFLAQGIFIALFGCAAGVPLGLIFISHINEIAGAVGLDVFPQTQFFVSSIPTRLLASDVYLIVALSFVVSFLASLYPAVKAARKDPIEALRYE
ncbi:MAG: FtsX-like permease family protein [Planctomycetota bacterium]|nr:FtsX-like permease family protein [Planctomycetota bacterium]